MIGRQYILLAFPASSTSYVTCSLCPAAGYWQSTCLRAGFHRLILRVCCLRIWERTPERLRWECLPTAQPLKNLLLDSTLPTNGERSNGVFFDFDKGLEHLDFRAGSGSTVASLKTLKLMKDAPHETWM